MDKKCTISSTSVSTSKGSQILSKSTIYSLIDCSYWKGSSGQNYQDSDLSIQTDKENYEVNLYADKLSVRKGMNIELFYISDGSNISIGDFTIDSVEYLENSNGDLDNIKLLVSRLLS